MRVLPLAQEDAHVGVGAGDTLDQVGLRRDGDENGERRSVGPRVRRQQPTREEGKERTTPAQRHVPPAFPDLAGSFPQTRWTAWQSLHSSTAWWTANRVQCECW